MINRRLYKNLNTDSFPISGAITLLGLICYDRLKKNTRPLACLILSYQIDSNKIINDAFSVNHYVKLVFFLSFKGHNSYTCYTVWLVQEIEPDLLIIKYLVQFNEIK